LAAKKDFNTEVKVLRETNTLPTCIGATPVFWAGNKL